MLRTALEGRNRIDPRGLGGWATAAGGYVCPAPRTGFAARSRGHTPSVPGALLKKGPSFLSCRMDIGPTILRLNVRL